MDEVARAQQRGEDENLDDGCADEERQGAKARLVGVGHRSAGPVAGNQRQQNGYEEDHDAADTGSFAV